MAFISAREIKNRIKSMNSTRQITKAMELVSASKLRGAQTKAVLVKEYFDTFYEAMKDISSNTSGFTSKYLLPTKEERPLYIVIAGDRGLAGGYNGNIFRMCSSIPENAKILPIGKRAVEYFKKKEFEIISEKLMQASDLKTEDCYSAASFVSSEFLNDSFDSVYIVYTDFINLISQETKMIKILPLYIEKTEEKSSLGTAICEPSSEVIFNEIVPEYLGGILFACLSKSIASEQAARRAAMNSATKNADEIIENLDLMYNRARQGAITQEITEIVAGSNA